MPDYSKLHDLVSHRVRLDYDTGAHIVGYLASCQPSTGQVQFAKLKHVELYDASGNVFDTMEEITLCPNGLAGITKSEGPLGRDV